MRVQQHDQSLRLRIDEAELARLLEGGTVRNDTRWPDNHVQGQRIVLGLALAWQRDPEGWCVTLPEVEVRTLAARLPSREGLEFELPIAGHDGLRIRFDVDVRDSARRRMARKKGYET